MQKMMGSQMIHVKSRVSPSTRMPQRRKSGAGMGIWDSQSRAFRVARSGSRVRIQRPARIRRRQRGSLLR